MSPSELPIPQVVLAERRADPALSGAAADCCAGVVANERRRCCPQAGFVCTDRKLLESKLSYVWLQSRDLPAELLCLVSDP